jgi:hypothetical protein
MIWTLGGISVMTDIERLSSSPERLGAIASLIAWAVAWFAVALYSIWLLLGREYIYIDASNLSVEKRCGRLILRSHCFNKHRIKNVKPAAIVYGRGRQFYAAAVEFQYNGTTQYLGAGLPWDETAILSEMLESRILK